MSANEPPQWVPQTPQPRPSTQDWRGRFGQLPQGAKIAIVLGSSLLILCCVCGLFGTLVSSLNRNGVGEAKSSTATLAPTSTSMPATPTSTPKPTATATPSGPQRISGPIIGGTEASFRLKYGEPSFNKNDIRHYDATINGTSVLIVVRLDTAKGGQRVGWMHLVTPDPGDGTVWSKATAEAIAKLFLPADAHFMKSKSVPDFGIEQVYKSSDLAVSLPADAFTDINTSTLVTPGTFYYSCGNHKEPEGGCTVNLRE